MKKAKKKYLLNAMKLLYPNKDNNVELRRFYITRLRNSILCFVILAIIVAILWIMSITRENTLVFQRLAPGEKEYIVTKEFQVNNREIKNNTLEISVGARDYSKDEAEKLFKEIDNNIKGLILGGNKSLQEVRKNLNLIGSYLNSGCTIQWNSSNTEIIENDGQLNYDKIANAGNIVTLQYMVKCNSFNHFNTIDIRVFPKLLDSEDLIRQEIADKVSEIEYKSRNMPFFVLPKEISGMKIKWNNKRENFTLYLVALVAVPIALYFGYLSKLKEKLKNRNRQMLRDYWEITGKLLLFINVGMSSRQAIKYMVDTYIVAGKKNRATEKKYIYEELLLTIREMNNGVPELEAYENCAKRCELMQYRKLFGYISQGVKKGSRGLVEKLQEEMKEAFEARKTMALRLGEEATSKLIIPMLLMLLIILVILMVPASMSLSM